MANSQLYNKTFKVPNDVLQHINKTLISNPNAEGIKRAKNILNNKILTYSSLKRLKNFFDYYGKNENGGVQYELAGGKLMRDFIEVTLNSNRNAVKRGDDIKRTYDVNPNSELHPQKPQQITKNNINESELEKNVVAIILNSDNRLLLLKREDNIKIWMPNKWGFVGGGINKNETPEQACKREIKEETGLEIKKLIKTFEIVRNNKNLEHIFTCRCDDDSEIILNKEHTSYGWYSVAEIKYLDTVPNINDYLNISFKNYV